jgi:hypothetical protein
LKIASNVPANLGLIICSKKKIEIEKFR